MRKIVCAYAVMYGGTRVNVRTDEVGAAPGIRNQWTRSGVVDQEIVTSDLRDMCESRVI